MLLLLIVERKMRKSLIYLLMTGAFDNNQLAYWVFRHVRT